MWSTTGSGRAQLAGRLRLEFEDAGAPGVGDWVVVKDAPGPDRTTVIERVLERRTGFTRRHVTTHRQLVLLPDGGLLLDTPGMRELQLLDEDGIDTVFGDIAALAGRCRFRDCRHDTEPGCGVKEAVESGALDRFEHYRKLEREARANELRHDEHRRRQAERVWGQLSDEVAQLRRWKGVKP